MGKFFIIYLNLIKKYIPGATKYRELKYYFRWKKSLSENASSVKDEQPWITFKTIDYLDNYLNRQSVVFEYGGGGSTLFFVKRSRLVFTVEHNKEWFAILSKIISKQGNKNWSGNFIEGQLGNYTSDPDIANPEHYSSDDFNSINMNYYNYVTAIDSFEDNYFDVILVDGRSRPSCIKHSVSKLKNGGLLILDNSDRDYYLKLLVNELKSRFVTIIDEMGASPYSREFTKTSIWKKIK